VRNAFIQFASLFRIWGTILLMTHSALLRFWALVDGDYYRF